MKLSAGLTALAVLCCTAQAQAAPITMQKDSADFGIYQYEMSVDPSTQNLDLPNATLDFAAFNGGGTVGGGVLNISGNQAYYDSSAVGRAWRTLAPTQATGYTIEARLRVNSQAVTGSPAGATTIYAGASDSTADSVLSIGANSVSWGSTSGVSTLAPLQTGVDNTDDFHIFRIAIGEDPSGTDQTFSVWRDGELLSSTLTDGFSTFGVNNLLFGDPGGDVQGNVDIDYLRFTTGAFAPVAVPEPASVAAMLIALGALAIVPLLRRRVK